jgi:DNA polymerase-3 subunit delta
MNAVDFIQKKKLPPHTFFVLTGAEDFLRRQVRALLESQLLGDADPAFAVATYAGDDAQFSTIKAELDTLPFLSPCRVVVIEQADPFVSKFRAQLEILVEKPSKGVLVLEVKTWPANTKLAKLVPKEATIECKPIDAKLLPGWCVAQAASKGKKLAKNAADMLVELVGGTLGVLDQEIEKLTAYVGDRATIVEEDVDHLVGRSRAAETFKIFDAIGSGQPAAALRILQRLFDEGESPIAILGAFSWQLRRLAQASRLVKQGAPVTQALLDVGVRDFFVQNWEKLIKHLGRRRLDRLYDWLVEADLGMKGDNPVDEHIQLQRLLALLAQPRPGDIQRRAAR